MTIKILGTGCPKCQKLEENTKKAIEEIGLKDVQVEHIYDVEKIIEMEIMTTPALVVDEEIVVSGKIPTVEEIKEILKGKVQK
ncbi:TM0996/MTH895 family glutaredoxin-like protein [Patescibacteria group bacterium]|nr:TM0996/MTH895 family glutaredoxin-like protein [Patescibacteria group bacterium]